MKLGIIGAGRIGRKVSKTLHQIEGLELYAVASRDLERAEAFASETGFEHAYGSYEELFSDPLVDLIYVCTPHSEHAKVMMAAINHGKNVICEKAFTTNAADARAVAALAREKKVYAAEAMWVRYQPSRKIIEDLLSSGIIGDVRMFSGSLSYNITYKERIMSKDMAGGALFDLGVYGINFALQFLGDDIKKVDSSVIYASTGVDEKESITIEYNDGRLASLVHSIDCDGCREGIFHGSKGFLVVDNINNPAALDVYDNEYKLILHKELPVRVSGYEYEFEEAMSQIKKGAIESVSMPLDDSIRLIEVCDMVRAAWSASAF